MRSTKAIADDLDAVIDRFLDGDIDYPECSAQTRALWEEAAEDLDTYAALSTLVDERLDAAFSEACDAHGIKLS